MITLNKKDLEFMELMMSEEQGALEKNMKEYDNYPNEMMTRVCKIGRLRVWACEQLEEKEVKQKDVVVECLKGAISHIRDKGGTEINTDGILLMIIDSIIQIAERGQG